jgi:hypothetical protein
MKAMMTFFAAILSTIAVGVLLVAYGLLSPRVSARDDALNDARTAYDTRAVNELRATPAVETYPNAPRATTLARPVSYQQPVHAQRSPSRDWAKTAMVIGGSTAAGAGLGGIFGGKKGALIGAAIGGGASTIYEVQKR